MWSLEWQANYRHFAHTKTGQKQAHLILKCLGRGPKIKAINRKMNQFYCFVDLNSASRECCKQYSPHQDTAIQQCKHLNSVTAKKNDLKSCGFVKEGEGLFGKLDSDVRELGTRCFFDLF